MPDHDKTANTARSLAQEMGGEETTMLSREERLKLAERMLETRTGFPVSPEDLEVLYAWAVTARVMSAMLDGILEGRFAVVIRDGEPVILRARKEQ